MTAGQFQEKPLLKQKLGSSSPGKRGHTKKTSTADKVSSRALKREMEQSHHY